MSKWTRPHHASPVCVDNIIPTQKVTIFSNDKPWVTLEELNMKKRVFLNGPETEIKKKEVNRKVKLAIKPAKLKYKDKVEQTFTGGNLCSAWQGLKNMAAVNTASTTRKPIHVAGSSPASLANDLNSFDNRFETDNSTQLDSTTSTLKPRDLCPHR